MIPLLALVIIVLIGGGVNGKPPSRIAGGSAAKKDEFKYMVAIMHGNSQICGGAIISTRHILTAGHCVENPSNLNVVSGITDLRDPVRSVHKVSKVVLHPDYIPYTPTSNMERDIAVIVLENKLTLGGKLRKVELPFYQIRPGYSATIAGWGYTSADNTETTTLLKTKITLLNENMCIDKSGFYEPDRLCGYQSRATLCGGDSGSPLVYENTVIGIASASSCHIGYAHIYTNVYYYMKFIRDVMRQNP